MGKNRSAILLFIIFSLFSCVPPAERRPEGGPGIRGRIVLPGNKVPPEPVVVRGNEKITRSDAAGNYALSGLAGGKIQVVAELKTQVNRYLAVKTVFYEEGSSLNVNIELQEATDIEAFCSACHPLRVKTESKQIIRDLHPSGIKPVIATKTRILLNAEGFVTCESCHTIHAATSVPHQVRYPYENGDLCNRCH